MGRHVDIVPRRGHSGIATGPESEDFMGYADGDGAFAAWCEEVHRLAVRFCGVSFFELEEVLEAANEYRDGMAPVGFFRACIIPELVCDHGYNEVEDVVADFVFWGNPAG